MLYSRIFVAETMGLVEKAFNEWLREQSLEMVKPGGIQIAIVSAQYTSYPKEYSQEFAIFVVYRLY